MPNLEYFLVCRSIQADVESDEASFIGVLEDIVSEEFPTFIPKAVAVSLWNVDGNDDIEGFQAVLVVKIPKMKDASFPMDLSYTPHGSRFRAVQGVLEIPIVQPGDITFEVLLNGEHTASHTVKVHPPEDRVATGAGEHLPAEDLE